MGLFLETCQGPMVLSPPAPRSTPRQPARPAHTPKTTPQHPPLRATPKETLGKRRARPCGPQPALRAPRGPALGLGALPAAPAQEGGLPGTSPPLTAPPHPGTTPHTAGNVAPHRGDSFPHSLKAQSKTGSGGMPPSPATATACGAHGWPRGSPVDCRGLWGAGAGLVCPPQGCPVRAGPCLRSPWKPVRGYPWLLGRTEPRELTGGLAGRTPGGHLLWGA